MKPSLPQGTRDFSAAVLRKRNFIFDSIRNVFELYGFEPLETPAMENIETLMGKYGEEGDKLIFKILNNGLNHPDKHETAKIDFDAVLNGKTSKGITERALRYDLTIPFARYVAMHHGQLSFPFKRYQMQPVWRADRPQRGRYREFYQCDADIAGSSSLLHEVELALIYINVFKALKVPVEIHINNRKILQALAELCGSIANMTNITIAIDKLDKIGWEKVKAELIEREISLDHVNTIEKYISIKGSKDAILAALKQLVGNNETGQQGLEEMNQILQNIEAVNNSSTVVIDPSLARGLNYYTGTIFEVKALGVEMGSIGGGGRYDDLTGLFGVKGIAGVGISFGVDRIYDVMEELNVFPENIQQGSVALIFQTGVDIQHLLNTAMQLRSAGIACEIFHENAKFDKQFKYAEKKSIPFVVILGEEEVKLHTALVKNLGSGEQKSYSINDLSKAFKR